MIDLGQILNLLKMRFNRRINVKIEEDKYKTLQDKLEKDGKTISQWVREKVNRFLKANA